MIGHQGSVTSDDFGYKTCRIRQSSLHQQSVFLCIKYKSEKYVQILNCMAAVWRTRPCMTTKMTKGPHHAEHEYSTGINIGVHTVTEEFGHRENWSIWLKIRLQKFGYRGNWSTHRKDPRQLQAQQASIALPQLPLCILLICYARTSGQWRSLAYRCSMQRTALVYAVHGSSLPLLSC